MGIFSYKALDASGNEASGVIDADDEESARAKLRKSGLFPTEVQAGGESGTMSIPFLSGVSGREVAAFVRQLATLIGAGFTVADALTTLSDQISNFKLKQILVGVRDRVNEGKPLSEAIRDYPDVFPSIFGHMVKAGEKAGRLPAILQQLSSYQQRQVRFNAKVSTAVAYPMAMFAVAGAVVGILLTWVVPSLVETFRREGLDLPLTTRILIFISQTLRDFWPLVLVAIAVLVYVIRTYIRTESGRERYDRLRLWLPVVGNLYRQVLIARFLRTFGILVRSDVPILTTIDILKNIVQNVVVARGLEEVGEAISKGSSIARPLKATGIFPPIVTDMVHAGQKAGQLDDLLLKLADEYEAEVENALALFTSLLEPIIIVAMGLVVSFIVMSVVLPLIELSQTQV